MPISLPYLQLITAAAFLLTAFFLVPSLWRVAHGNRTQADDWRSAMFFASLLFAGFAGRWLVAPLSVLVWKLLYAISIALAVYTWVLLWNKKSQ